MTGAAPTLDPAEQVPPTQATGGSAAMPPAGDAGVARPYAPSWLDAIMAVIDGLPFPPSLVFLAIAGGTLAVIYGMAPLSGQPSGPSVALTYYALLLPAMLWLFHYLNGVARTALGTFRPLLGARDADVGALRYELTVVPAGGAWLLLAATVPLTVAAYVFFPDAEGVVGLSPAALAIRLPYEIFTTAVGFVALYRTVRQLRLVHRIHAMALHIDLYQPAPLYAFSSLTAQAGMGFFLLLVPLALLVPSGSGPAAYAVAATWFVTLAVISIATFVLPLEGMHRRIAAQKRDLESAAGQRLTATIAAIHLAVDDGDLAAADGLNKNLASLIAERDMVEKLPTWPWRPGTIGAFVTAILLPIGLWLMTRLLERVI